VASLLLTALLFVLLFAGINLVWHTAAAGLGMVNRFLELATPFILILAVFSGAPVAPSSPRFIWIVSRQRSMRVLSKRSARARARR
jgi:hypothetical protein